MKMDSNQPNRDDGKLDRLGEALRGLEKERILVPAKVDEAILSEIRERFKPSTAEEMDPGVNAEGVGKVDPGELIFRTKSAPIKIDPRVKRWHRWLPLVASIAIAALFLYFARVNSPTLAGDINRDGALDVVDAFLLAERVQFGGETARAWDLNGDGRVDALDSAEIMSRIVDLERNGS